MRKDIKALPSIAVLHALLSYEKETGALCWRIRIGPCSAGSKAGTVGDAGYLVIGIGGFYYLAHRLIWKIVTGDEPTEFVDHIDGDKLNNRWANFRPASNGQNIQNAKRRSDNTSGVKGVHWDARHKKWRAVITANRKSVRLGRFSEIADAESAIIAARAKMHGAFARIE